MSRRVVKYLSLFALMVLFGCLLQVERHSFSFDEKATSLTETSLNEADSDEEDDFVAVLVSADELVGTSVSPHRVIRPYFRMSQGMLLHLCHAVRDRHSIEWCSRNRLQFDLRKHIFAYRYAWGYYIYGLRRLLI